MKEFTYAAIISISLPGMENAASTHITLTPPDNVQSDGRIKPLRDCTLADIRAFAGQFEAEVWETYRAIRLIDMVEQDGTEVRVTVGNEKGEPVALQNWMQQAILLPSSELTSDEGDPGASPPEAASTSEEAQSVPAPATPFVDVAGGLAQMAAEPAADEALSSVMVLESEPVYAEREAVDDPSAYPTPAIAPSQARVRIAGRRRPIGRGTWAAVDILMEEPALRATQAHALSSLSREVAGVLLGPRPEKQPDGRYVVHVIDTIIAKHTVMHGASVTYTPESWRYMNDSLAERYPDESVVMAGWYHTHPGFGIFLSGMDQFIHHNFFTQIWHIAFVLDPIARRSGLFCWDIGQTRVNRYEFFWPSWAEDSW